MGKHGLAALLAWCVGASVGMSVVGVAMAQPAPPRASPPPMPEALSDYFEQALAAERLTDPVARCRAYPDLPGNAWPEGAGSGRCALMQPVALTLDELDRMLGEPEGPSRIDALLAKLLDAHYDDPTQRDRIFVFFGEFDGSTRGGTVANRWLRAAPDSAFAKTAMGSQRIREGFNARGSEFIGKTSKAQLRRMDQHFVVAVDLLQQAFQAEPRLTPACLGLAQIGRQSSDALQIIALNQCLARDPLSFFLVDEMVTAAMPRWGGSPQALRQAGDYIHKHGPRNPALYVHMGEVLSDGRTEGKTWSEDREVYMEVARLAPDALALEGAARAQPVEERWLALAYLSQALRYKRKNVQYRDLRAGWWASVEQPDWLVVDLEWLAAERPDDAAVRYNLGYTYMRQERLEQAREQYRLALSDPVLRERALAGLCSSSVYDPAATDRQEMRQCIEQLVTEYPDNKEYRIWHVTALARLGDKAGLKAAIDQFKTVADLSDARDTELLMKATMTWKGLE